MVLYIEIKIAKDEGSSLLHKCQKMDTLIIANKFKTLVNFVDQS